MTPHVLASLTLLLVSAVVVAADAPRTDRHGDPLPDGAVARYGSARLVQPRLDRVEFSPGGKLLVTTSHFETRVWDAKTGRLLQQLPAARVFAPTPDGVLIAGVDDVRLFDAATGKVRRRYARRKAVSDIVAVAVTPDGKTAVVSDWGDGVNVHDLTAPDGAEPRPLRPEPLHHACISADGRRVAGVSQDDAVEIWDVRKAERLQSIKLEGGWDFNRDRLALSDDGSRLAVAHGDRVGVWLTATGKPPAGFMPPKTVLMALRFSADGRSVIGLDYDGPVITWSADTGKVERTLGKDEGWVGQRALADDNETVAAQEDKLTRLRVWNVRTGKAVIERDPAPVTVRFVGRDAVASEAPGALVIWGAKDGKIIRSGNRAEHAILSPDGKLVATPVGDPPKEVVITAADGGKVVAKLASGGGITTFAPDSKAILTWVDDRESQRYILWDATTGRELRRLTLPETWGPEFSPDGRTLVAEGDADVVIYEMASGGKVRDRVGLPQSPELGKHDEGRRDFRFSRDGRTLLVLRERDVVVTSLRRDGPVFQLQTDAAPAAALSPDGRWLATDNGLNVEVRDLRSRRAVVAPHILRGHEGSIRDLAFSPDGKLLVSASHDGTALVWDVRPIIEGAERPAAPPDGKALAEWWAALADEPEKAGAAMRSLESHPEKAVALIAARLAPAEGSAPAQVQALRAVEVLEWVGTPEARKALERLAEGPAEAPLTKEARASLGRMR